MVESNGGKSKKGIWSILFLTWKLGYVMPSNGLDVPGRYATSVSSIHHCHHSVNYAVHLIEGDIIPGVGLIASPYC